MRSLAVGRGRTDGWTDGRTDRRTDERTYLRIILRTNMIAIDINKVGIRSRSPQLV